MHRRLLDVTAYTTLDFVEASALGVDWTEAAPAVVDVGTPEDHEDLDGVVRLSVELDGTELHRVKPHVARLDLSTAQARTLAADLVEYADRADDD
jgi:NADH:ubiquinone oxidoreductase subunit D